MKKIVTIFAIIGIIIVASFIGWLVFKYAIGLVAFFIFAMGGLVGYGIARLFPPKSKTNQINQ